MYFKSDAAALEKYVNSMYMLHGKCCSLGRSGV